MLCKEKWFNNRWKTVKYVRTNIPLYPPEELAVPFVSLSELVRRDENFPTGSALAMPSLGLNKSLPKCGTLFLSSVVRLDRY